MSARALAKSYLKYWYREPATGNWVMADNAPTPLLMAVRTLPKSITRNMAYEALGIVAGNASQERPLAMLLEWLKDNPAAVTVCDTVLKSKRVPPTLAELVEKSYAAAMQTARNHLTTCLDRTLLT